MKPAITIDPFAQTKAETTDLTNKHRLRLRLDTFLIDPSQWDHRAEAHRKMLELNAAPQSALVRELADTLFFQSHPEQRN